MPNDDYRLPIIYDALNRWGADDDFFCTLANETPQARDWIWAAARAA